MRKNAIKIILLVLLESLLIDQACANSNDKALQNLWDNIKERTKIRTKKDSRGIITAIVENDCFTGTDRGYTNGVRLSYTSPEEQIPAWIDRRILHLPLLSPNGKKRVTVALGQSLFTPNDITLRDPPSDDRPYAGWLYSSFGVISDTDRSLDIMIVTLGIVGPAAQAEDTQRYVHNVVTANKPMGWSHQLHNELGINLTYERKWREIYESSPFGLGFDIIPHIGVNLGNVFTNASLGATFRLGNDLPNDYGPPRIRPGLPGSDFFIPTKNISGYLFAAIEGRLVARDIFLDGNSFRNSAGVEKENAVVSLQLGASITYGDIRLSYTHLFMTKEFKTQRQNTQFGGITASYRF